MSSPLDFGPLDPFVAYRDTSKLSPRWDDAEPAAEVQLVARSMATPRPWLAGLFSRLGTRSLSKENCPNCEALVEVNSELWRQSGAALTCDACADCKPGTLIASDTKEPIPLKFGVFELPPRMKQMREDLQRQRHGRLKSLIAELDGKIQEAPSDPWLYVHRGDFGSSLCEFEETEYIRSLVWLKDFDTAVNLAPEDAWIRSWRALAFYGRRQKREQVIADLEYAMELDPEFREARDFLEMNRDYLDSAAFGPRHNV